MSNNFRNLNNYVIWGIDQIGSKILYDPHIKDNFTLELFF